MKSTVGLFATRATAERAVAQLRAAGIAPDRIVMLTPGVPGAALAAVPTTETEPPGLGAAVGGVVGGAVGASTAAAASAFVPGVGPVITLGVLAAAFLGAGAGAAVGDAVESALDHGVPRDELFWYEEALRRGKSVAVVLTDTDEELDRVRSILREAGAESLDAAREQWWLGVRTDEAAAYTGAGFDWAREEVAYRRGFEAALHPETRGRRFEDVVEYLRARDPEVCATDAFRRGFDRGQAYMDRLREGSQRRFAA
jgi:hypothetical protein